MFNVAAKINWFAVSFNAVCIENCVNECVFTKTKYPPGNRS